MPCVTLRENTERPETIEVGLNMLAGIDPRRILAAAERMMGRKRDWSNPFGDGRSSKRIIDVLIRAHPMDHLDWMRLYITCWT